MLFLIGLFGGVSTGVGVCVCVCVCVCVSVCTGQYQPSRYACCLLLGWASSHFWARKDDGVRPTACTLNKRDRGRGRREELIWRSTSLGGTVPKSGVPSSYCLFFPSLPDGQETAPTRRDFPNSCVPLYVCVCLSCVPVTPCGVVCVSLSSRSWEESFEGID